MEKTTKQDVLREKYFLFKELLASLRPLRQKAEAVISEQRGWLDKYLKNPGDWKAEITKAQERIAQIEGDLRVQREKDYEKLLELGTELVAVAVEKANAPLDVTDEKLQGALTIATNSKLDYELASGIASQFAGNGPALRVLRKTFEGKGIHSNIDTLIYSPDGLPEKMREYAYHVIWQNGAPESFLNFMEKNFARFEGLATAEDKTEASLSLAVEAARSAAGLKQVGGGE